MELAEAYRQIEERLSRLDFEALFAGFSRFPFALYDDAWATMGGQAFERPDGFLGNTSVMYNGAHTAIWRLTDDTCDMDVLASKIVHEMLHAFQNASGEKRWADERQALVKYRCDAVNLSARLREAACMKKCLEEEAPEAFEELLALRKARMERFFFEYDYEARIEQIEGTAHDVELAALRQLDAAKAEKQWTLLFGEISDPARYFPVRAVTYLTGAAFIVCLRKYTDLDICRFSDEPLAVSALRGVRACALPGADPRMEKSLSEWQRGIQDVIDRALEKNDIALSGDFRLVMWNVYDGVWNGKFAVLSAFIGYIEGELPRTDEELFARMKMLNGDFVTEVNEDLHLTRVFRQ